MYKDFADYSSDDPEFGINSKKGFDKKVVKESLTEANYYISCQKNILNNLVVCLVMRHIYLNQNLLLEL